jgi:hypothetical protein
MATTVTPALGKTLATCRPVRVSHKTVPSAVPCRGRPGGGGSCLANGHGGMHRQQQGVQLDRPLECQEIGGLAVPLCPALPCQSPQVMLKPPRQLCARPTVALLSLSTTARQSVRLRTRKHGKRASVARVACVKRAPCRVSSRKLYQGQSSWSEFLVGQGQGRMPFPTHAHSNLQAL